MSNILNLQLKSVRDLFEKLNRDADLLDEEVTSDRLWNFVVTGYSMIDWIKNDPSVPANAKTTASVDTLYQNQCLKVCGDIATACKHFSLKNRKPITQLVNSNKGFGRGRFGKGGFGTGEETIDICLTDGSSWECLLFVENVIDVWEKYFSTHNI